MDEKIKSKHSLQFWDHANTKSLQARFIVSSSRDKTLQIWDAETGFWHCTLRGQSDTIYN